MLYTRILVAKINFEFLEFNEFSHLKNVQETVVGNRPEVVEE